MQTTACPLIAFLTPMATSVQAEIARRCPPGFSIAFAATQDRAEHIELLKQADFVIVASTFIDAEQLQQAKKLKLIQKWGTGIDKIDITAAQKAGIAVAITSGVGSKTVAEHTIMLMLAVYRNLPYAHQSLCEGRWIASELRSMSFQLAGKTIGLLGFGNIAQNVAKRLMGFDVNVIYHSRRQASADLETQLNVKFVDADTLLSQSDILSLHIPLDATTRHMINAAAFARMKPSAIVINTARGEIIDEHALIQALDSGSIAGAGLDTFEGEPPLRDNPLFNRRQVVVTPHSAGSVMDNVAHIVSHAFRNIETFANRGIIAPEDCVIAPPSQPVTSELESNPSLQIIANQNA